MQEGRQLNQLGDAVHDVEHLHYLQGTAATTAGSSPPLPQRAPKSAQPPHQAARVYRRSPRDCHAPFLLRLAQGAEAGVVRWLTRIHQAIQMRVQMRVLQHSEVLL